MKLAGRYKARSFWMSSSRTAKWSAPEISEGKSDFVSARIYTWSWHGLRKYVVRVYVDPKDGRLRDVKSEP